MKRAVVIVAISTTTLASVVASCTVFDGLVAGVDAGATEDAAPVVEAGVDGGPDLSRNTQPGYLSVADGVAFCSNAFSCPLLATSVEFSIDVPVDTKHFSSCVDWVSGPLPKNRVGRDTTATFLQCAANAKTCTAAAGCMWYELLDQSDGRCKTLDAGDAGTNGVCAEDGGALYFCNATSPAIEHCTNGYYPAGFGCNLGKDGISYCAAPTCTGDQCSGPFLTFCGATNKLFNGWNCNVGGFTCGFDAVGGFNDCLTDGVLKRCSALNIECAGDAGDIVALCDSVYLSQYDCNVYGGKCERTGAFPRCTRPGATCTPADPDVDVCNGSTINLCVGGARVAFDCGSVGKTCTPAVAGHSASCR